MNELKLRYSRILLITAVIAIFIFISEEISSKSIVYGQPNKVIITERKRGLIGGKEVVGLVVLFGARDDSGRYYEGLCAEAIAGVHSPKKNTAYVIKDISSIKNGGLMRNLAYYACLNPNDTFNAHLAASLIYAGEVEYKEIYKVDKSIIEKTIAKAKQLKPPRSFEAYMADSNDKGVQDVLLWRLSAIPNLNKSVTDENEKNVENNILDNGFKENFTYNIKSNLPAGSSMWRSIEISDELPKLYIPKSIKIYNGNKEVTSWFTIKSEKNKRNRYKVAASFKYSESIESKNRLKNGADLNMEIVGGIDPNATVDDFKKAGNNTEETGIEYSEKINEFSKPPYVCVMNNKPFMKIESDVINGNNVTTKIIGKYPKPDNPKKTVSDSDENMVFDNKLEKGKYEKYKYNITNVVPKGGDSWNSYIIEDELPLFFNLIEVKITKDGKDITEKFKLSETKNNKKRQVIKAELINMENLKDGGHINLEIIGKFDNKASLEEIKEAGKNPQNSGITYTEKKNNREISIRNSGILTVGKLQLNTNEVNTHISENIVITKDKNIENNPTNKIKIKNLGISEKTKAISGSSPKTGDMNYIVILIFIMVITSTILIGGIRFNMK